MTIEQVKFWVDNVFDSYDDKLNKDEIEEAKRIVNKSLDAMAIKALEQQPCEDCISRQAVLDIIMPYCQDDDGSVENTGDLRNALDDIESLPPVTPEEKTGRWIMPQQDDGTSDPIYYQVRCSKCNFDLDPQTWNQELHQYNADKYCPKCGARMVNE